MIRSMLIQVHSNKQESKDGEKEMDNFLKSYIDQEIINEYAFRSKDGLSLQICDVESNQQENFIDILFNHDPITRELLLDRAQELIEQRLPFVEAKQNYNFGLKPIHDNQTGEVIWITNRSL